MLVIQVRYRAISGSRDGMFRTPLPGRNGQPHGRGAQAVPGCPAALHGSFPRRFFSEFAIPMQDEGRDPHLEVGVLGGAHPHPQGHSRRRRTPPPSPTLLTHACMCVCTCRCLQLTCDSAHIGVCITSCESKAAKMSRSRPQCQWGPGSLHAGGLAIQMAAASDKETAADTSALSGDDATLGRSAL